MKTGSQVTPSVCAGSGGFYKHSTQGGLFLPRQFWCWCRDSRSMIGKAGARIGPQKTAGPGRGGIPCRRQPKRFLVPRIFIT